MWICSSHPIKLKHTSFNPMEWYQFYCSRWRVKSEILSQSASLLGWFWIWVLLFPKSRKPNVELEEIDSYISKCASTIANVIASVWTHHSNSIFCNSKTQVIHTSQLRRLEFTYCTKTLINVSLPAVYILGKE